jgi:uncharacterized protein YoxC
MKKLIILSLIILFGLQLFSQERRLGTYNGKRALIEYSPGPPGDVYFHKIELDILDELNLSVNRLNREISALRNDTTRLNRIIRELEEDRNDKVPEVDDARIKELEEELKEAKEVKEENREIIERNEKNIKDLKKQIDDLKNKLNDQAKEIEQLRKRNEDFSNSAPVLGASYNFGFPSIRNEQMNTYNWVIDNPMSRSFKLYYESEQLMQHRAISWSLGLGITNLRLGAGFSYLKESLENQTDMDNDVFTAICLYENVNENLSLTYLDIPIGLSLGVPRFHRVGSFIKIGITPSFKLTESFEGHGLYTIEGYYPEWDVTINNVDELGFRTQSDNYSDLENSNTTGFIIWGNISGGVYVPLRKDSRLTLKLSVRCDYTMNTISQEELNILFPESTYRLNQINLISGDGSRVLLPGINVGILYKLW